MGKNVNAKRGIVVASTLVLGASLLAGCGGLGSGDTDIRRVPALPEETTSSSTQTPSDTNTPEMIPTANYGTATSTATKKPGKPKPKKKKTPPPVDENPIILPKGEQSKAALPKDVNPEFYRLFVQQMKQEVPPPAWLTSKYIQRFVRIKDGINIYTVFNPQNTKAKDLAVDMCEKANRFGLYDNIPSLIGQTTIYSGDREEFVTCG